MCCGKKIPFFLATLGLVSLVTFGLLTISKINADDTKAAQSIQKGEAKKVEAKQLRHVVMFQFKENTSEADIKKVVDGFRELPKKIKAIADFEWGTNNSPEGLADGLTHCFLVTFSSEKDRDTYLTHPDHQAFVEILKPHLQRPVVLDFWASK
jgi:Stress responsive A/B Barrel Domain